MPISAHILKRSLPVLCLMIIMPARAPAQLISLKTVPIATGDQFLIFPSQNLGMGGVSIALEDSLLDPFINPAKGTRLKGKGLMASPGYYRISENNGGARTLPLGTLFASGHWFGGVSFALQELIGATEDRFWVRRQTGQTLSDRGANNVYAFGLLGKNLPGFDLSVGASIFWADLAALEGVDLLYAGSQDIDQYGHVEAYRAGLFREWDNGRSFELLLLLNRLKMTHKVTYVEWGWERPTTRVERNLDHTDTWGIHVRYVEPPGQRGWRRGVIATMNVKSHPKIPNYEIMNIPRDPGDTWAYNLGLGFSRKEGSGAFGVDIIYEPIWSHTWANADTIVETVSGKIIPRGDMTVENDFRFSNGFLRIGIRREEPSFGFQLGVQVRSIRYWLDQHNYVEESDREQEEHWLEWTPTWGLTVKFPEFHLHYNGRLTTGTGRPGVAWTGFQNRADFAFAVAEADFILAPSGDLTLQEATVVSHQISVSIPIHD